MKYMLLIVGFSDPDAPGSAALDADQGPTVEEFLSYERALVDAGVRVDGSALDSVDNATTVQVRTSGERVITNGPFAETREYLGGYVIVDVPDLDAALDWAARCPGARYGRVEVRPLLEF